jgi:hypothetical protein
MNKAGIEQLKADLRANAERYDQSDFGTITKDCGTEACMAGFCLMRQLGFDEFTERIKDNGSWLTFSPIKWLTFRRACLRAAVEQLGLEILPDDGVLPPILGGVDAGLPPIFSYVEDWPSDLRRAYSAAAVDHDHPAMVEVACQALDRMDVHGFINPLRNDSV